MTGKRFNNIGKTVKVSCRVCRIAINGQSYYDHLKAKHPEENPKDRSTYGQKRLVFTAGLLSAGPVLAHPDEPSGRVGDGGGGEQGGEGRMEGWEGLRRNGKGTETTAGHLSSGISLTSNISQSLWSGNYSNP